MNWQNMNSNILSKKVLRKFRYWDREKLKQFSTSFLRPKKVYKCISAESAIYL